MVEGGDGLNLSIELQQFVMETNLDDMASSAVVQAMGQSPEDVGMCNNSQRHALNIKQRCATYIILISFYGLPASLEAIYFKQPVPE